MLNVRIIPCLDISGSRVVKGTNFINLKDAGDPIEASKYYASHGADEIIFLDITATHENHNVIIDLINEVAKGVFIPLTVGGGIKDIEDIRNILNAGADKVSLNSSAVKNPEIIKMASHKFGVQCIVVAIDAKKIGKNKWTVFIHGGRINTGIDVIFFARKMEKLGAGEILLTSMDNDGTKNGYDTELLKIVSNSIQIPIIASGGAGKIEDFHKAYCNGASAMLGASLFHYRELTISDVKKQLRLKNIPVRI
ncbi:MAG: imidazole glycerol phosphate synthase subunit HisF [Endomicrobium sp.]|jgi:cyclase|nr:imidazole glycerol phosphate synthase subunit HisF [Endomicrobium sp.]